LLGQRTLRWPDEHCNCAAELRRPQRRRDGLSENNDAKPARVCSNSLPLVKRPSSSSTETLEQLAVEIGTVDEFD
jgi:hypothetical protein